MGRKDEMAKAKVENEAKERQKGKSYASDDPFKINPNRPSKNSNKKGK